jgi:hypothetical protein
MSRQRAAACATRRRVTLAQLGILLLRLRLIVGDRLLEGLQAQLQLFVRKPFGSGTELHSRQPQQQVTQTIILCLQDVDASNPTGKLMLTILGAVATFEREIMLERQREGIAAATLAGKYKGRAPTAARRAADMLRLARTPGVTRAQIAKETKMSVPSVYRVIAARRAVHGGRAPLLDRGLAHCP